MAWPGGLPGAAYRRLFSRALVGFGCWALQGFLLSIVLGLQYWEISCRAAKSSGEYPPPYEIEEVVLSTVFLRR